MAKVVHHRADLVEKAGMQVDIDECRKVAEAFAKAAEEQGKAKPGPETMNERLANSNG